MIFHPFPNYARDAGDQPMPIRTAMKMCLCMAAVQVHQQLMADASLCLGFSATAMHYVSEKPCEIEDHVHMVGATLKNAHSSARRRLQTGNVSFSQSSELAPGGRFICLNFGIDEKGRYLGHTGGSPCLTISPTWRAMRDEGRITIRNLSEPPLPSITGP